MVTSETDNSKPQQTVKLWLKVVIIVLRLLVGATFILSGFTKAVDPVGVSYKISEYFSAFGLSLFLPFSFMVGVMLSVVEFWLGVIILVGAYPKLASRLLFLVMLVMTPLTGYLAIANPVSDCGCFGDALHLSNVETFLKNLPLLLFSIVLLKYNSPIKSLYSRSIYFIVSLYALLFSLSLVWIGANYEPILDFRPYKIGVNIPQAMTIPEGKGDEYKTTLIYTKDGEEKEFSLDNYPQEDTTWHFVRTINTLVKKGEQPLITDFVLYNNSAEDVTEDILGHPGYTFLLLSPDLSKAGESEIDRINELYDYSLEHAHPFYCVTGSSPATIKEWLDNTGGEYPLLFADPTMLKTIMRSNPGVLVLKDGKIIAKIPSASLPGEDLLKGQVESLPLSHLTHYNAKNRILFLFIIFVVPLLLLLLTEKTVIAIIGRVRNRKIKRIMSELNGEVFGPDAIKEETENDQNILLQKEKKIVMRKNVVAGNWKMNKNLQEGIQLAKDLNDALANVNPKCDVVIATPFIHLASVVNAIDTKKIGVGAENCADKASGAYTGEVSAEMVASTGAKYVILGHSERRAYYGETPAILKEKTILALANNLTPIFCIGEVLQEREDNKHFDVVKTQIEESLFDLSAEDFGKIILAYEPVWAIGTGQTASADQAQEIHAFIRKTIADKYGKEVADNTTILYGGSCNDKNAEELFSKPDVDGGLIGGAALKVDSFMGIINAF